MKHLLMLLVILLTGITSFGQTIYYRYDASGNRTARDIVLKQSKGGDSYTEKNNEEDQPPEVYSDQLGKNSIRIYPNPAESHITVEIQGLEEDKGDLIYLYDQTGRLVLTLSAVTYNNTLDLSGLTQGIYLMVIKLKSGTTKWKIIKE